MNFKAQRRLSYPEPPSDGCSGHPYIDAEAGHFAFPHVQLQIPTHQRTGYPEIPSYGLANIQAVEGPGHRISDVIGYGAVVLMPYVEGSYVVEMPVHYRPGQLPDPLRGDAPQVAIDHHASPGAQSTSRLEDGSEGAALPRQPPIGRYQSSRPRRKWRGQSCLPGAILRSAVRVYHRSPQSWEVQRQPAPHYLHHPADGFHIMETGNSHHDVGESHVTQLNHRLLR